MTNLRQIRSVLTFFFQPDILTIKKLKLNLKPPIILILDKKKLLADNYFFNFAPITLKYS